KGVAPGSCIGCGAGPVDWPRLYRRDIADYSYLKEALQLEMIRHVFWAVRQPTEKAKKDVRKKSPDDLAAWVRRRLITTLSKPRCDNPWDGRQTPYDDKLLHWAQHATATCCRKCLAQWYGIGADIALSEADYAYFTQVVVQYLIEKCQ
ncbi:MAG: DUF4186 family protein, partial [Eubacteriales bacterium]|nr:DUF4186 family protein [Eubacteriales bacterium]